MTRDKPTSGHSELSSCICFQEEGYYGAHAYFKAHQNETDDFNFVMESDEGAFTPKGLFFGGEYMYYKYLINYFG